MLMILKIYRHLSSQIDEPQLSQNDPFQNFPVSTQVPTAIYTTF